MSRSFLVQADPSLRFCQRSHRNRIHGTISEYVPYWAWYLYMLIGLYMVTPFIKKMIDSFKDKDYKIFILFFLLIPGAIELISLIVNNFTDLSFIVNPFLLATFFSINIAYYIAGYYLANSELTKKIRNTAWITLAICLLVNTLVQVFYFKFTGYRDFIIDATGLLTMSLSAISVFILARYYFENKKPQKIDNLIGKVSNCVFGVYLIHGFFTIFFEKTEFMQWLAGFNSYLWVLVMDVSTFLILTFLVYWLRKIPFVKKFL